MNGLDQVVVAIPAYQPAEPFVEVVRGLRQAGFEHVLVVNDGSSPDCAAVFDAARDAGAIVLHHPLNRGKGEALKTALKYFMDNFPDATGIVTCDADGQHLVPDVMTVSQTFLTNQSSMILGARKFDSSKVPFRSRFGNETTKVVFRNVVGMKLTDTQTGLRAIPRSFVSSLLMLKTAKYDFELEMLIEACNSRVPLQEVPITTVYSNNNQHSHFNPLLDSARIYFVFLRFSMASIVSAIIDFAVFFIAQYFYGSVILSMALARLAAGTVNFIMGRRFTFKSRGPIVAEFVKYWLLVALHLLVSYSVVRMLVEASTGVYVAKLIAEGAMFIFSFLIQRSYVFNSPNVPVATSRSPDQRIVQSSAP